MADSQQDVTDIIAIDGPAGAGKSTVARRVADALGYAFLDTGAMYRAATWWALEQGIDLDDASALAESTRSMQLDMPRENGALRVLVNGQDVSEAIRTPEITRRIRKLDHNPEVRTHLVELQRRIGAQEPTVAEGRDIGTVVFPRAKCKIYLDASIEERARRRAAELTEKGIAFDPQSLRDEIQRRDESDMTRPVSPLRCAEDAVRVDTTSLSLEAVVDRIIQLAKAAR